jgi:hypothetical protein
MKTSKMSNLRDDPNIMRNAAALFER